MLDVCSSMLLCSNFIFHLSFLNSNSFLLCAFKNFLWRRKLICQLIIYLGQSITFGSNNLATRVFASLLQRSTIMCEHSSSFHYIMPFYKEMHTRPVWTRINYACIRPVNQRT
jgi:hypothetical protein